MTEETKPYTEKVSRARPEGMPRPTYWPFIMAVSVFFTGWGLISTWIISIAGLTGFFIALAGWIKELIHERRKEG